MGPTPSVTVKSIYSLSPFYFNFCESLSLNLSLDFSEITEEEVSVSVSGDWFNRRFFFLSTAPRESSDSSFFSSHNIMFQISKVPNNKSMSILFIINSLFLLPFLFFWDTTWYYINYNNYIIQKKEKKKKKKTTFCRLASWGLFISYRALFLSICILNGCF